MSVRSLEFWQALFGNTENSVIPKSHEALISPQLRSRRFKYERDQKDESANPTILSHGLDFREQDGDILPRVGQASTLLFGATRQWKGLTCAEWVDW